MVAEYSAGVLGDRLRAHPVADKRSVDVAHRSEVWVWLVVAIALALAAMVLSRSLLR